MGRLSSHLLAIITLLMSGCFILASQKGSVGFVDQIQGKHWVSMPRDCSTRGLDDQLEQQQRDCSTVPPAGDELPGIRRACTTTPPRGADDQMVRMSSEILLRASDSSASLSSPRRLRRVHSSPSELNASLRDMCFLDTHDEIDAREVRANQEPIAVPARTVPLPAALRDNPKSVVLILSAMKKQLFNKHTAYQIQQNARQHPRQRRLRFASRLRPSIKDRV